MVENEFASSALRSSEDSSLWGLLNLNIHFILNFIQDYFISIFR